MAGVVEGTVRLVVDPLADTLQDRDCSRCAAAAAENACCTFTAPSSVADVAEGAQAQPETGRWDLVFSRQSRQRL